MSKGVKSGIDFCQTDEERARRNAHSKGKVFNQSKECLSRWENSYRRDELKALREYGVSISYDSVRSHNTRLYRP